MSSWNEESQVAYLLCSEFDEKSCPVGVLLLCFAPDRVSARYDEETVAPKSGPGVLLRSIDPFPFVVVRISRALRDQVVCRSNIFIEFGDSSVSTVGVEVSAAVGKRKFRLLSYGLFVSVVVEWVKRGLVALFVGNGVRERNGSVSASGVEPNGVGVLLRGLSTIVNGRQKW